MGALDDRRHQLGVERAVELDLHVAHRGIAVHPVQRFLLGAHQYFGGAGIGAGAVHEAGHEDARSHGVAALPSPPQILELVDVVGHVAHGGDAGRHVEQAVVLAEVGVHVPQAGEEGLPLGVDDLGAGRSGHLAIGANGLDAVAGDDDGGVRHELAGLGIEQPGVLNDERPLGMVGQLRGLRLLPRRLGIILGLGELGDDALPALGKDRGPALNAGNQVMVGVQPLVPRAEAEAVDRVEVRRPLLAAGLDLPGSELLDAGLAGGQQGEPSAGSGEEGAGQQLGFLRRPVEAEVESGSAELALAVLRRVLPGGLGARALERLVDRRLPIVDARGVLRHRNAPGLETEPRLRLRSPGPRSLNSKVQTTSPSASVRVTREPALLPESWKV